MARRRATAAAARVTEAATEIDEHVFVFVRSHWAAIVRERCDTHYLAEMAETWGPGRAVDIIAHALWSENRRDWLAKHPERDMAWLRRESAARAAAAGRGVVVDHV